LECQRSKINEEFEPQQGTSNQGKAKVVLSTTKPKDFYVKPEISFGEKVYP
jgi:hypothetical protein